jgi:hypothetical protein
LTGSVGSVRSGLRGSQRPGLLHLPDGSDTYVGDALYLLDEWGFGYDEAQQFVIASSLREMPDGRWAAKEFGLEEPRQNGKGEAAEGRECLGLFYLGERKLVHSAHEFATASEALDRMDDRIGQNPQLKARVKSVKRSHGEEGVYLKDGRKLLYKTRTKGGGRGFSADFLLLDEAMYVAEAFLGALMPVISARPNPQIWYMGSAVDQNTMDGVVFARLRQRALDRQRGRMAYLGWSAAYVDGELIWETPADVPREATTDSEVVARANPALGIRIDLDHVLETEWPAMSHETFCVERLGVGDWPTEDNTADQVIDLDDWDALEDAESRRDGAVCFCFDVSPDRRTASVAVAGHRDDGFRHAEVARSDAGTAWVVPYLTGLSERHDDAVFVCDDRGPAASLIPDLLNAGVEVLTFNATEHARACGAFVDAVAEREFRHLGDPRLKSALRGASQRPLGDAWAWSRKSSSVDISPLVAVTLALWGVESYVDDGMVLEVYG